MNQQQVKSEQAESNQKEDLTLIKQKQEAIEILDLTGNLARKSYIWIGNLFAMGFSYGGSYIQNKIQPNEQSVQESTSQKIDNYKQMTQNVYESTKEIVKNTLNDVDDSTTVYLKNKKTSLDNDESNINKKLNIQILESTYGFFKNNLQGIVTGFSTAGGVLMEQTSQILNKKYQFNKFNQTQKEESKQEENPKVN